jgi:hypothetical protein
MARICATGSDVAADSAPAGGVLSTRAGAFRFRTGGPGSSDSRATGFGALVVEGDEFEEEEFEEEESDEELEADEPDEVGLRFRRGRSGSSSFELEEEEDAERSDLSDDEPLVFEPDALSCRLTRRPW